MGFFLQKKNNSTHQENLLNDNVDNTEYTVCDSEGQLMEREVMQATDNILAQEYKDYINKSETVEENSRELNNKLASYIINNTTQEPDGRLTMPSLWNPQVSDKLSQNQHLALSILQSQTLLPSFEGKDIEDISRFLAEFEKAILPYKYTDYDKFLLLKKQTIGKAGSLLGSLDGSKQTYRDAKTLLQQAFADREIQKYNLLSKLTSLNLKTTDSYELYSEFNSITASLDNLFVSVKDLYRFSLWKTLPHAYQTQYLAYSTDSVPEFDVLKKHYFDVCCRVQNSNTQTQEKETRTTESNR